ncbi:MAG TPA: Re/Si-specific NAD(P)(+) transhydrogenase subunit alpha [Gemmatimonadales bacterium]|jgi:H+-translocating NAD(P) transhydrogenase subunit alpha|nr:Re/Si-specific NAD(P)(+) transhydrogenase subunit alpha [Gemmatimonadales bacterium]
MRIGVPAETRPDERRVALVPDGVGKLTKAGCEVLVQRGAGIAAYLPDAAYEAVGATMVGSASEALGADLVLKVQRPTLDEIGRLREGAALVSFLAPAVSADLLEALTRRKVSAFAMELVPRTTKAQSMDALSSQATIAGYKAVLLGGESMGRIIPMLTTAAGTLAPAKIFVVGAGVAGLQAIATARRLGGLVSAFDVRSVVREQVQSLGASFVEVAAVEGEGQGGYAKELADEQQRRVVAAVGTHAEGQDLVITTAQIPGRAAPRLLTAAAVRAMKPGSVVVDLAAESGGNCELTRPGETVTEGGVTVLGPVNLAATVPLHASQMYGRNVLTFVTYLLKDGALNLDLADPITGPMCVTHAGDLRTGKAG